MEDEIQERFVERGQAEEGHRAEEQQRCGKSDPGVLQNFSGRSSSAAIRSANETSGAQAGEVSAMVRPSLTPIATPATSGPRGLPRPQIITTANTTPIHAWICAGASV